jgi:tRNA(Arg) A34 adenosine deaminase TadA
MTTPQLTQADEAFLRRAIELAREARAAGRHPFGSLIVDASGALVVESRNNAVPPAGDPTQHAELLACTLYTSTEPCAMCAGAIYWTGIGRVVYALAEKGLLRFTGSHADNPTLDLPCREVFARGQRKIEVSGPHLEEEASVVHKGFWT